DRTVTGVQTCALPISLRDELASRVFGERCIEELDARASAAEPEWERLSVSGSDSSTHASVMRLTSAPTFTDDMGAEVVTFNNSRSEERRVGKECRCEW